MLDATFSPKTQEVLKIWCVTAIVKMKLERYFCSIRHIRNWLRNSMSTDLLAELTVSSKDCFKTSKTCHKPAYMWLTNRKVAVFNRSMTLARVMYRSTRKNDSQLVEFSIVL